MKIIFCFFLLFGQSWQTWAKSPSEEQIQNWIFESMKEIPLEGGYELTLRPAQKLRDAFYFGINSTNQPWQLNIRIDTAKPSYCTTATYLVFYKTLQKFWKWNEETPSLTTLLKLKPEAEDDGIGLWGRWNSNGPGTSKFFHDAKIGINFDDIKQARAGDFLKIFWNEHVGKYERGHSVIFLGLEVVDGKEMIRYWSSNKGTRGYGEQVIPRTDAIRTLFSRLTFPQDIKNIEELTQTDEYLKSMLTTVSNWDEVRKLTGIQ
ncbi:MAG: hypothetical protein JNM93_14150 [Bacteriovoracaceae bacterium]|nr:hypothetical protein [Bacteriovoracaceae bacterium]